jgi:hypothetical protein
VSGRKARLLIPDTTPLSLLAMAGRTALDWLFAPGAEVWITDMVMHEALRDPEAGGDWRSGQRAVLRQWFTDHVERLHIQETPEGQDYAREMRNWARGGSEPSDRPSWRNRGERSIQDVLGVVGAMVAAGEAVILLVDDRAARALLINEARISGLEADLMATETFLVLLEEDYGVAHARDVWLAIHLAAGGKTPEAPVADPVYVRKPFS